MIGCLGLLLLFWLLANGHFLWAVVVFFMLCAMDEK
jgi:hypothetical protein